MTKADVEILLVEDDPGDVELTLHALRKAKLANHIEVMRDGEEALDFLFCRGSYSKRRFDSPPKVVLLDLKLPKVDGLEVLRELKGDPRTKPIPVVVLTASGEERDMVAGYNLGANAYIQKPVDFKQFNEAVETIGLFWLVVNRAPSPAAVGPAKP